MLWGAVDGADGVIVVTEIAIQVHRVRPARWQRRIPMNSGCDPLFISNIH